MIETLKKTLYAGIGVTVVTSERIEKSLKEMVEKGKLKEKHAKQMLESILEEGRKESEEIQENMEGWFESMLDKAGVVNLKKFEALQKKVDTLEKELDKLKKES